MSTPPRNELLLAALGVGVLLLAAVRACVSHGPKDVRTTLCAVLVVAYSFLSWKHGYIRADKNHVVIFLSTVPLFVAVLLSFVSPSTRILRLGIPHFFCILCLISLISVVGGSRTFVKRVWSYLPQRLLSNASALSSILMLDPERNFREVHSSALKGTDDLPRLREVVGQGTVDVINYRQAIAIRMGLNYHLRPVIQGYSAYTPHLMTLNLDHYKSSRRPEFILFAAETIDNRFPSLDDALLLPHILQNYLPVGREKAFLLLRQRGASLPPGERIVIKKGTLRFGQSFDIPYQVVNTPLLVSISVRETVMGKVLKVLYQLPPVEIRVSDGTRYATWRLIPSMARGGFLLSPILSTTDDVQNFYGRKPGRQVRSFTIICRSKGAPLLYQPLIEAELYTLPGLIPFTPS